MPRDAIGMIGGGRRKPKGQVDVALIQSLVRKGEVDDIVGNYGHWWSTNAIICRL
jgi:superfamily II DNA or RNA helicase